MIENCGDVERFCKYNLTEGDLYFGNFENEPIFTVFPNPTDGILSIQLLDASPNNDSQLYLTDLLGKRVKSFPQDSNTLVISEFPNGIYFVVLEKEGQKHWKKVVKH